MDKLNWILTVVLVLIGFFGVRYARRTLKAIEGQLVEIRAAGKQTDEMITHAGIQAEATTLAATTAKQALEIAERADILLFKIKTSTKRFDPNMIVILWLKNLGRTRAESIVATGWLSIMGGDDPPPERWTNSFVLGAGDRLSLSFKPLSKSFTQTAIEGIRTGQTELSFRLEVEYRDLFGKTHANERDWKVQTRTLSLQCLAIRDGHTDLWMTGVAAQPPEAPKL